MLVIKKMLDRYLAVVDFATHVEVPLNWTDVSSTRGKNKAFEAIKNLKAGGGTNLDAGIKQATSLFLKDAVKQIQKDNRNTVVLLMEHLLIILKIVKVDVLFYIHMSQLMA